MSAEKKIIARTRWRRALAAVVSASLLAAAVIVQTSLFRQAKSITFDEAFYVACARQTFHDGKLDQRLALDGVAPVPILMEYSLAAHSAGLDREDPWQSDREDIAVVRRARLATSILVGAPLVLVVFGWLYFRQGLLAAILGGGLMAFSPSILAHASLAATDACFCLFALLALAAIDWYFAKRSVWRFLLMALAASACLSAKYSGVFLAPVIAILFLWDEFRRANLPGWKRCAAAVLRTTGKLTVFALVAAPLVWACHLFSFAGPLKTVPLSETPDWSPWVRLLGRGPTATKIMDAAHTTWKRPAPVAGVWAQTMHQDSGHVTYLMGEHRSHGWWYYFPVAIALKSTPAEYVLFLVALAVLLWSLIRWRLTPDHPYAVWGLAAGVFLAMAITSTVNIGHRHVLLLYPLAVLIGVDAMAQVLRKIRGKWLVAGAILLVQAASAISIAPHYLAYFSPFFGGPQEGRRYLVDSNLDWGQDLPRLKMELQQRGMDQVLLAYFGSVSPEQYGLPKNIWKKAPPEDVGDYQAIAISATLLQGSYTDEQDPFECFRSLSPTAWAGYSIAIFELNDAQSRKCLRKALALLRDKQRLEHERPERELFE